MMPELTGAGFELSEQHAALRETVADFARERVSPVIGEYYAAGRFPYPLVAEAAELVCNHHALHFISAFPDL